MYPHCIRLREPWVRETYSPSRSRLRRKFGLPSRIDAEERVWLTLDKGAAAVHVSLNGHLLGPRPAHAHVEYETTHLIQRRNELILEIENMDDAGDVLGDIALEIRCTAFLRNVRFQTEEDRFLRVTGEVVGFAGRSLELYALVDNRTVAYAAIDPAPNGTPFALRSIAVVPKDAQEMRVELVNGASVWYRVESKH